MRDDMEAWEERRFEPREIIDLGDRVLVIQHEYRRGRQSGAEVEAETAVIFTIDAGRITRVEPYMDPAEARKAAGLARSG